MRRVLGVVVGVASIGITLFSDVTEARAPRRHLPVLLPLDARDAGQGAKNGSPSAEFSTDVLVLHATNSKKGIDQRIGRMPELKKPPFSAYDSYELLDKSRLTLRKDDPKTIKLPNGRVFQAKLLQVLGKDSLRIAASISQPGGKDFLPLLEVKAKVGQAFIVAGQSYRSGILVVVIRVVK